MPHVYDLYGLTGFETVGCSPVLADSVTHDRCCYRESVDGTSVTTGRIEALLCRADKRALSLTPLSVAGLGIAGEQLQLRPVDGHAPIELDRVGDAKHLPDD